MWNSSVCPLTAGVNLSDPALSAPAEQGRNSSALQLADALTTTVALAVAGALFARGQSYASVLVWTLGLSALALWVALRVGAGASNTTLQAPASA